MRVPKNIEKVCILINEIIQLELIKQSTHPPAQSQEAQQREHRRHTQITGSHHLYTHQIKLLYSNSISCPLE